MNLTRNSMQYGAYCGLTQIGLTLLAYMTGMLASGSNVTSYLGYGVVILFQVLGTIHLRKASGDGSMTYGRSLASCVMIVLFASIIIGFFNYLLFSVIDPDLVNVFLNKAQEQMEEKGLSESTVQMQMEYTRKFMTPVMMFIFTILAFVFFGFIFGLIISIFTKKESNPFAENS